MILGLAQTARPEPPYTSTIPACEPSSLVGLRRSLVRDLVRVAVVDNGCGVLATLKDHRELTAKTHPAAIIAALKPRVSCNRDVGVMSDTVNQGVGLTTTYRIAEAAGGGLVIVSGNGYHNTKGSTTEFRSPARWDGVAIALFCQREGLPVVRVGDQLPPLDAPPVKVRFEK